MKRIIFDVPRWNIYLHRRERKLDLVSECDSTPLQFQDELFDRLFNGESELLDERFLKRNPDAPWAKNVHESLTALGLNEVVPHCKGNATNAALATEWIMQEIQNQIENHARQKSKSKNGQSGPSAKEQSVALEHVSTQEAGEETEQHETQNNERVEKIAKMLENDARLKRIAELAGKFKRILLSKQKSKIKHESDEICDIEQGGDVTRLVPSEFVRFLSKKTQLLFKGDLLERKLLQYSLEAKEPLGRGPLVLCVDKSGSMEDGKDEWATALALTLLDMAHRQKRPFILLGFDTEVFQRVVVKVGQPLPKKELFVKPRGGTDIARVLDLALSAVEKKKTMRRADIVLITDGESDTRKAEEIRKRAQKSDVSIFGIGIGVNPKAISPWCDEAHVVTDMGVMDEKIAEGLLTK